MSVTRSKRAALTAYVLASMALLASIFSLQGAMLDAFSQAYALDGSAKGFANTAAAIGSIVALITAFYLQGRMTKYAILRMALGVSAVTLLVLAVAPNYALFTAAWLFLGVGIGWIDGVLSACMADLYQGKLARIMMCMLQMTFGLSSTVSPLCYKALMGGGMNWHHVYIPIVVISLALLVISYIGRASGIRADETPSRAPFSASRVLSDLWAHHQIPLMGALLFHGLFLNGLNTWINRFAEGLSGDITLPAMSCLFAGIMLSRLIVPFTPIKTEKYVAVAGFLSGAALLMGLWTQSAVLLRVCVCLSGLLFGALIPCILNLGCQDMAENTLLATTGMMFALYFGQIFASPLIGFLEKAINLRAGMIMCAAAMPLCSVCCMFHQKSRARH